MKKEFQISIPKTLRDIKLKEWQRYIDVYNKNKDNDNEDFLSLKMLQIFCGVELKDSHKIPISSFDAILEHLGDLFNSSLPRVNQFSLKGTDDVEVTFGLIPNLDKMSYGEWVDLENYIYDDSKLHKAMAVLYRPLATGKGKDRYLIHPYNGTEEMSEVMKEMPIDVALGARVFFYRLATKLGNYILASTLQELREEEEVQLEKDSEKNGERTKQYINSLMERLKDLEKLPNSMFTNA